MTGLCRRPREEQAVPIRGPPSLQSACSLRPALTAVAPVCTAPLDTHTGSRSEFRLMEPGAAISMCAGSHFRPRGPDVPVLVDRYAEVPGEQDDDHPCGARQAGRAVDKPGDVQR